MGDIKTHIKAHHKKYLFGSIFGALLIKLAIFFVANLGVYNSINITNAEWNDGVWNNDVFIDQTFWDNGPTDEQIIDALYGDGNVGEDTTAYTTHRTGNTCDTNNITVSYVDPGTDQIPEYLSENTIYVLLSGSHITSRNIYLNNCSAIVGSGDVTLYSNRHLDLILYFNQKENIVVNNVKIDGQGNGDGTYRDYGCSDPTYTDQESCESIGTCIDSQFDNDQLSCEAQGSCSDNQYTDQTMCDNADYCSDPQYTDQISCEGAGSCSDTQYNNDQSSCESNYGCTDPQWTDQTTCENAGSCSDSQYTDSETCEGAGYCTNPWSQNVPEYTNEGDCQTYGFCYEAEGGILSYSTDEGTCLHELGGAWLEPNTWNSYNNYWTPANNTRAINLRTSAGNTRTDNFRTSAENVRTSAGNIRSLRKNMYGILLRNSSNNTINDSQIYNNLTFGIALFKSLNNLINNSQIYNNNEIGLRFHSSLNNIINNSKFYNNNIGISLYNSGNNTINNSQVHNNNLGIYFYSSSNNLINNVQIYNNSDIGISLYNSLNNIINGSQVYNNTYGIYNYGNSIGNKYYGNLKLFANFSGDIQINEGGSFDSGSESDFPEFFSGGVLDGSGTMSCDRITNPRNSDGIFLIDTGVYTACEMTGINTFRSGLSNNEYIYGSNILKQAKAIADTGVGNPSIFSWSNLPFNSDYYIASNVGGPSPLDGNEETLMSLYYGSGSEYTTHRESNACDSENMTVEYINNYETNGADTIPEYLSENVIYVLLSGSHITSRTINLNNCSAIVGSGDVILYSSQYLENSMLYAETKENIIIDNVNIDSENDGLGSSHYRNEFGIYLESSSNNNSINNSQIFNNNQIGIYFINSNNNSINNSQIYNNSNYGIYLYDSSNNYINNSQAFNNGSNGILFYSSNNNSINNSQFYNNQIGIYLESSSNNNSINNSQIFNNNQIGIYFINSNNNSINNSQIYNNSNYGIYLGSSSNTTINNSQAYNNSYGIYNDGSSTNNKYYGTLKLFD
ncbi:MAG: right-handed parallel beta-helix repeat-containing protein, partial [Candidatus Absconditabacterales bacterium]